VAVIDTYELSDRYRLDDGRVFLSGSQALARLPYEQLRADRRAGLRTAAYVTGYPGSPLANYDRDVAASAKLAEADGLRLVFQPGMNEELAATAVMGSQLAVTLDSCRYDGVLGIWYGKAPGLDRASDALRHATFAGTSPLGGAVALVGDDPNAKSSTLPSSSGATLVDLNMPIVYPGDVQEAIDLGRHAVAMSRASGLWVSIKVVEAVADGTGSVEVQHDRISPIIPTLEIDGRRWVPQPSGRTLTPYTLDMEREFHEVRLRLAREYATVNRMNTIPVRGPHDWVGIAATGVTYRETLEALRMLGFRTDDDLRAAGIRLFKLAVPVPLDIAQVREFAEGLDEVIVVEEKTQNLEWLVKDALFGRADHPVVVGKRNPDETTLFPFTGTLEADSIAPRLRSRLAACLAERMAPPPPAPRQFIPLSVTRTPFFCSGCPHNSSTKVPDGALIGAGIGCHSMVLMMEEERVGHIVGLTAMGNEGAQWFGMAPFVDDEHIIQNIGDGTLFHSGMTAIRAAIANGANITYKILYNGAVAMTGGQDPFGQLDVMSLTKVLLAEGVQQVIITTDDLSKYRLHEKPAGVKVWGRSRLIEAQEELSWVPGCTVLIHDQRCAAEKRRDRKRNRIDTPEFRVVINERVCEGCGDCGDKSNCLSVQPVDTEFGRKTRIDQGSCNFDLSCMEGDCPSFMKVPITRKDRNDRSLRTATAPPEHLPDPVVTVGDDITIRLSGIGGTGVVTTAQILGTAAMLQGFHVRGLDQTGLSQKAGPVVSDLRLSRDEPHASNKASAGSVDLLLAFDQLVGGNDGTVRTLRSDRTVVVANTATVPTGSMVVHPDRPYPIDEIHDRLDGSTKRTIAVDAARVVSTLLGDESTVNVFMTGVALQAGLLPLDPDVLERAIELNGVAVQKNLWAFRWGRAWAADPAAVQHTVAPQITDPDVPLVDRLADDLRGYQHDRYAAEFLAVVESVDAAGHPALTEAVARHLHKLMAYKDEYEVARLLLADSPKKATFLLHPPMLRSLGMRRKIGLRRTARLTFRVLRAMRRLRGTPFDVFGYASLRRTERAMVPEYVAAMRTVAAHVTAADVDEAVAIASLPDRVRGYEHLKAERADAYRTELAARVEAFIRR
jgi:indolepyruvate ferredoxin oxidoreductase